MLQLDSGFSGILKSSHVYATRSTNQAQLQIKLNSLTYQRLITRALCKWNQKNVNNGAFISLAHLLHSRRTDTISPASTAAPTRKKSSSKKSIKSPANVNNSYEHHLEKWLENTSKMNFDYNNLDGNWPFMNAPNAFPANRKGNSHHLQQFAGSNDPISLPSHIVSSLLSRVTWLRVVIFREQLSLLINYDLALAAENWNRTRLHFMLSVFFAEFHPWRYAVDRRLHEFQHAVQTAISALAAQSTFAISD